MTAAAWTVISILWIVVLGLVLVVLSLARQIGVLHERLRPVGALQLAQGLKVGEPAPVVEVQSLSGFSTGRHASVRPIDGPQGRTSATLPDDFPGAVQIARPAAPSSERMDNPARRDTLPSHSLRVGAPHAEGRDTLLMFISPSCPVCKSLLPSLRAIRRNEQPRVDVILASDGSRLEHLDFIGAESLEEFPYVLSEPLGVTYGVGRLPYAVLIDGKGVVRATGLVNTREQLDSLFEAKALGVANLQELHASGRLHHELG